MTQYYKSLWPLTTPVVVYASKDGTQWPSMSWWIPPGFEDIED